MGTLTLQKNSGTTTPAFFPPSNGPVTPISNEGVRVEAKAESGEELEKEFMLQDDLMASESVDGRPPTHRQQSIGWTLVIIGIPALAIFVAARAMNRGMTLQVGIGFGIVFLFMLVLGGFPVLAAGLSRRKEQAIAHKEAVAKERIAALARRLMR